MKRTRTAVALTLLAAFSAPAIGLAQQGPWQPTVAPAADPFAAAPQNYVWQPAVYGSPAISGTPSQFAGYSMGGDVMTGGDCVSCQTDGCATCGGTDCGCGDWLSDRFGVCGLWGSVEFMHAWAQGRRVPLLVTGGATFGDERIGDDRQSAGRIIVGAWFDECENLGAGVRLFGLEGDNAGINVFSDATGVPQLGVPFTNVQTGLPDQVLAAFPGELSGGITVNTSQDVLSGESYLRALLVRGNGYRVDLIGGYHYSQISDGLDLIINTTSIDPAGVFPVGSNFLIADRFNTRNDFHGAVTGLQGELRHGRWRLHTLGKVSVGNMREELTISGSTIATIPGIGTSVDDVGVFAQASNTGTFVRDETAYIPEGNINLGYQLTDCVELTVGYTFIYWSNVLLAGDQIDTNVDLSGNTAFPAVNLRDTDFWVQGVTLGANWVY